MIHLSYRNFSKSLVDDNVENLQDIEYAAMLKSIFFTNFEDAWQQGHWSVTLAASFGLPPPLHIGIINLCFYIMGILLKQTIEINNFRIYFFQSFTSLIDVFICD